MHLVCIFHSRESAVAYINQHRPAKTPAKIHQSLSNFFHDEHQNFSFKILINYISLILLIFIYNQHIPIYSRISLWNSFICYIYLYHTFLHTAHHVMLRPRSTRVHLVEHRLYLHCFPTSQFPLTNQFHHASSHNGFHSGSQRGVPWFVGY